MEESFWHVFEICFPFLFIPSSHFFFLLLLSKIVLLPFFFFVSFSSFFLLPLTCYLCSCWRLTQYLPTLIHTPTSWQPTNHHYIHPSIHEAIHTPIVLLYSSHLFAFGFFSTSCISHGGCLGNLLSRSILTNKADMEQHIVNQPNICRPSISIWTFTRYPSRQIGFSRRAPMGSHGLPSSGCTVWRLGSFTAAWRMFFCNQST